MFNNEYRISNIKPPEAGSRKPEARKNRPRGWLVILILALTAICWDLTTSNPNAAVEGTLRYESEFETLTASAARVAIVPSDFAGLSGQVSRDADPGYSQIEAMVRKAIALEGGLERIIRKGDQVMLKVNLVGGNSPSGQGCNTDVRVVKAVVKIIHDMMAGNVEIIIAEGTARANDDPAAAGSVWEISGYTALLKDPYLAGINLRLLNLNKPYEELVEVNLGQKATAAPHNGSYRVHRSVREADVFISIPVLKIHNTGITCALKNQIGIAPGIWYGYNKTKGSQYHTPGLRHDAGHRRWTTEEIVDFSTIAGIDYVVVDAVMCLETYKDYKGNNQVRFNTVVAGADPVAVDHICTKLFGLNPDDIAHITLAEKMGLGTNDGAKIEVTGAAVDAVRKRVKKNPEPNGVFGQSNRTWILSQTFQGSEMTQEYIPGESALAPEAGKNGWSQPVYFFDDRIDLLSYYHEPSGVVSYAFTRFSAPMETLAELWMGYDESITVYLNGQKVHSFTGTTTFSDAELVKVKPKITVRAGENTLLVKTYHKYGDYSFTLNICEVESNSYYAGNRLPGLTFYSSSLTGTDDPFANSARADNGFTVFPNPVTSEAYFRFALPEAGMVTLTLYDLTGRVVSKLMDTRLNAGEHSFDWYPGGTEKESLKSGTYLCVLQANQYKSSLKIVIR